MLQRTSTSSSSSPSPATAAPTTRPAWKARKLPPPPSPLTLRRIRERLGRARRDLGELAARLRPFDPRRALDAAAWLEEDASRRRRLHLAAASALFDGRPLGELAADHAVAVRLHHLEAKLAALDAREARADGRMVAELAEVAAFARGVILGAAPRRVARLARFVELTASSLARAARCGASTRAGGQCRAPRVPGHGRCKLHGGASTGPKSAEGKARALAALAAVNAKRRAVVQDCA